MRCYTLKARNGYITFIPSVSCKTVLVSVIQGRGDLKSKRLKADKARGLYKTLVAKGYVEIWKSPNRAKEFTNSDCLTSDELAKLYVGTLCPGLWAV